MDVLDTTRGEIRLKNETIVPFPHYTVSRGVPLPPGTVRQPAQVSIVDADGKTLPSAGKVLQRRPDGSIEWLLVDFTLDLGPEEKKSVYVELKKPSRARVKNPVTLRETRDTLTLANGVTSVTVSKRGGSPIRQLVIDGREVIGAQDKMDLETVDAGDKIYRASLAKPAKATVAHHNALRGTVKIEGTHAARDGTTFLDYTLRLTLTAGCADLKIEHTFHCREQASGPVFAKAIRLVLPTRMDPAAHKLVRQRHHGQAYFPRPIDIAENAEVVSSSVNDLDNYKTNFKPFKQGAVFLRNMASLNENFGEYPYHMRPDAPTKFREDYAVGAFRQVFPFLGWVSEGLSLVAMFERWSMLHPKSIAVDEGVMTASIWPAWAEPCRMVQGVSKTHTLWLTGAARKLDINECEHHSLRWEMAGLDPVAIAFDPAWPIACEVLEMQHMLRYQPDQHPFLENLIEVAPAAGNPDRFTYYRLPGHGMFHFGDHGGEGGFTNNEDDCQVLFPLLDYLRTGNVYCFDYGQDTARHYMEVDFCDFSTNTRQDGGLIAHTVNHFEGMAYPSHQWSEGILAYYYLTGSEWAAQVVKRVGDHLVWWSRHGLDMIILDGREAGMPLVNLAAAYRLTHDKKYLKAAHAIIDAFHRRSFEAHGELRYPYPQGGHLPGGSHQKNIRGYGDWSSYSGLYRIWEVTGDEKIKALLIGLLKVAVQPESFNPNDARAMDFLTVWIYMKLTGDEGVIDRLERVIPMLLRRGGHPVRRLHFLKELDDRGLIDERLVGSRGGVI